MPKGWPPRKHHASDARQPTPPPLRRVRRYAYAYTRPSGTARGTARETSGPKRLPNQQDELPGFKERIPRPLSAPPALTTE
eukprot:3669036-Lingulodinium_polyedra.AAC.1